MELAKFIGCLLGTAIGDSLGAKIEGTHFFQEIKDIGPRYTDDTAMMIGAAESLIEYQGFDPGHMASRFVENFEREPWRGYAWGPPRIFRLIRSGRKWDELLDREIYPGGSFGNGAAMRIAPVGLFYHDHPEKLREVVYQASKITHSHELALEGAALQAYAVARAISIMPAKLDKEYFLNELVRFVQVEPYKEKLVSMRKLLDERAARDKVIQQLGNSVEALNSVPAAIYSFLLNTNFADSIIFAVGLGGDADTIGAMAGAIAGACYGVKGIPRRWMHHVENGVYLQKLGEKLWQVKMESKSHSAGKDY
jgi:poly(ADP-ribose) glycohydrolase ARH3